MARHFSLETREKMRQAKLGKKVIFSAKHRSNLSVALQGNTCGRANKGRILSPEWRKKISITKTFVDRSLLKKSDRQNSGAYYEWSKTIKNRDGHKCKIANKDCSGSLNSHHILSWREHPELRYDVNNGITLCRFHHPLKYAQEKILSPYFKELIAQ